MSVFLSRFRGLLEEFGKTQKEICSDLGIRTQKLSNWKTGYCEPSFDDIVMLANYFEVSTDYLLGRSDDFGNIVLPMQKNSAETLSAEEKELVNCYRSCTIAKRGAVMEYARFASERSADEIRNRG